MNYECSIHRVPLIPFVRLITSSKGDYKVLPYFQCPYNCDYVKPNKWRKAWPGEKREIEVLQQLKDGLPVELMPELKRLVGYPNLLKETLAKWRKEKCGESQ